MARLLVGRRRQGRRTHQDFATWGRRARGSRAARGAFAEQADGSRRAATRYPVAITLSLGEADSYNDPAEGAEGADVSRADARDRFVSWLTIRRRALRERTCRAPMLETDSLA